MRRVLRFYEGKQNVGFHSFDDIVYNFSDYQLQTYKRYIKWLFPSKNDSETKLTTNLIIAFDNKKPDKTTVKLRENVVHATSRMIQFFGYKIKGDEKSGFDLERIKELKREEKGIIIGLFNTKNFPIITRILLFLKNINMRELSSLFFLMILKAIEENSEFKTLVKNENVIQDWIKTQPYLENERYLIQEKIFGEQLDEWEKSDFSELIPQQKISYSSDAW